MFNTSMPTDPFSPFSVLTPSPLPLSPFTNIGKGERVLALREAEFIPPMNR